MRSATRKPAAVNDTNSGAVGAPQTSNDIPLNSMDSNRVNREEEYKSGILDQIAYGITGVGGFIYQNSYIFTNVLMMVSEITINMYKSDLSYVVNCIFVLGLVYCLSQLAYLCFAIVGQCIMDDTQSTQSHDAFQSLHCHLCGIAVNSPIYLWHGFDKRRAAIKG